jgi:hypothetical protein
MGFPLFVFSLSALRAKEGMDRGKERVGGGAKFIPFQGPPTKNGVASVLKWGELISTLK